ncbi:MAG: DUF2065 family protein [Sutterella sp.]|nr:DUF2065 family protein [Sutterella sp.]
MEGWQVVLFAFGVVMVYEGYFLSAHLETFFEVLRQVGPEAIKRTGLVAMVLGVLLCWFVLWSAN